MPENETLDLSQSPRWNPMLDAIRRGAPVEEVADRTLDGLIGTLKSVANQMPLDLMIVAAERDYGRLQDLANDCRECRQYAQLFRQIAEEAGAPHRVVERFVWAIIDQFFDQVPAKLVAPINGRTLYDLQALLSNVRNELATAIDHIANKLATEPTWNPSRRLNRTSRKIDNTREILEQSLIVGRRRAQ